MPELPDLEIVKERLQTLVGDSIASVEILFPLTFRVAVEGRPEEILVDQKVQQITRRGKFLVFKLSELYLVFNLMLTGRLVVDRGKKPNTVVRIGFSSGRNLVFADFKKMGKIYVTDKLEKVPQYSILGVEPLSDDFTLQVFRALLKDPREIKIVLTDQKVIAGIGNAYVDEILFHARLNPGKKADSLTDEEIATLYESIDYILEKGMQEIERKLEDTSEEIRDFFSVHGKKGELCPVCGSVIREIEIEKRVTNICPKCQKIKFP